MNVSIPTGGCEEDEGLILLTLLSPSEHRRCGGGAVTALLTVVGKDHEMTAAQLEKLGKACLKAAQRMREKYR